MKKNIAIIFLSIAPFSMVNQLYAHSVNGEHLSAQKLALSEKKIQVTSNRNIAVFQLYDTRAAVALYRQLPLELELSNFRQAQ
ncbi:hypothetical protein [Photobacterium gaetbulicola]|uniref:hypothetical protein n=1 Tax=Photobacterium gaetbulicola TaxID=1295392 RepID=UPI00068E3FE0|nr:hypothetical protein [Photobacterium gaetbulicola]